MPIHSQLFSERISRRCALGAAAAIAATPAFAEACTIGPPPHEKGPRVWMEMDQIELDAAYDQSVYAPLLSQIVKRYASSSNETRARLGVPKRLAYGPTPVEALDLYPAKTSNAPIFVEKRRIMGSRPKFSSMPVQIMLRSILLLLARRMATLVSWRSKCGVE